mmetsp:Transcript_6446/g.7240  ORF Transcript_6446/g.7240 Transcript_6446/m.7240 type:complete len:124 (+) Transcript_6446:47-418(+)
MDRVLRIESCVMESETERIGENDVFQKRRKQRKKNKRSRHGDNKTHFQCVERFHLIAVRPRVSRSSCLPTHIFFFFSPPFFSLSPMISPFSLLLTKQTNCFFKKKKESSSESKFRELLRDFNG